MKQLQLTFSSILVLGLLSGVTPLAIDTYLPSIPTIADSIQVDINLIQLTVSVYLLTFAFCQLFFGPISDAFGRRRVIFFGLIVYSIGSLLCALADGYSTLMIGRVIQAIGGGAVAVCVPALVRNSLSSEQFAKAMSYVFLVMTIAPLVAPQLGSFILLAFDWHYIFIFLALIGLIALACFTVTISETLPESKRNVFSIKNILINYKNLISDRLVLGHILAGASHFSGLMCFVTGSAFVYIEFYGVEEQYFGLLFGLNVVGIILFTAVNTQLVERIGSIKMIYLSMVIILVASTSLLTMAIIGQAPLWVLVIASTLFVCTVGALGSNLMAGALQHSSSHSGSVVALAGATRFLFGALSGLTISVLHDGTFIPMVTIMALSGFLCFIMYYFVVTRSAV